MNRLIVIMLLVVNLFACGGYTKPILEHRLNILLNTKQKQIQVNPNIKTTRLDNEIQKIQEALDKLKNGGD